MAFIRLNYKSYAIGMDTNVTVILPSPTREDPQIETGRKYPVLWLLHGGGGDDMEYLRGTYVQEYAEKAKIAVVSVTGANSCYLDTQYAHNYFTMVTEELPNLIYNRFPVSSRREDNAIAGFSMGAAGAVWLAIRRNDRYGLCVPMSGMPDGIDEIIDRMSYTPKLEPGQGGQVMELLYGPLDKLAGTEHDFRHMCDVAAQSEWGFPVFRMMHGSLDTRISPRMRKYAAILAELGADVRSFDVIEGLAHEPALCDVGLSRILGEWMKEISGEERSGD